MVGLLAAVGSSACGAAAEPEAPEAAHLQAVFSIQRLELADAEEADRSGNAIAQFLLVPAEADPASTLSWAGLGPFIPEADTCVEGIQYGEPPSLTEPLQSPLEEGESLELLEAGEVSIQAGQSKTELALNFFPVSGSAAGVLYTSRDRSAAPLPSSERYQVDVTGSEAVPRLTLEAHAPESLAEVSLAGEPVEQVSTVSLDEDLELSWRGGAPSDLVIFSLQQRNAAVVCAFSDEAGQGFIPAARLAGLISGSTIDLGVHRVHESVAAQELRIGQTATSRIVETTMRFDFERAHSLLAE